MVCVNVGEYMVFGSIVVSDCPHSSFNLPFFLGNTRSSNSTCPVLRYRIVLTTFRHLCVGACV